MCQQFIRFVLVMAFLAQSPTQAFPWLSLFNKTMSGVHWTLVVAPALMWAGNQIAGSDNLKQYPDASPEVATSVKATLKKHNCPEELIDNLQIKVGKCFQAGYILNDKHIITIPKDFENVLPKPMEAIIRHEAAHLEHKDMWRMIGFSLLAPSLSHYLVKGITYPISHALKPYTPIALQSAAKIPLAFAKIACMVPLIVAFAKYKEYWADKRAAESISDLEVLNATAKLHLSIYETYEQEKKLDPKERGTLRRFIYDELHTPDIMHPNYLTRSQIFENAAKKLEATKPTIA